ncbi:MAG: hypothetical protein KAR13_10675 [Desulfobulbaceae bacterium]|nr:hypothetical protein [Desulfobulbaceae bacterium]
MNFFSPGIKHPTTSIAKQASCDIKPSGKKVEGIPSKKDISKHFQALHLRLMAANKTYNFSRLHPRRSAIALST